MGFNQSVNGFRARRGRVLARLIRRLASRLGRDVTVLDIGGRADYWENVGAEGIARIDLLNLDDTEFADAAPRSLPDSLFRPILGDGRDLSDFADQSIDLVHSNSVIEHVGGWRDMAALASEARRVGRAGWIQTPAWIFPVEPHFHLPFIHWFAAPIRARLLALSPITGFRTCDLAGRRWNVEQINLLTRSELRLLFPGEDIHVERLILPKSYAVHWLPPAL